MAEGQAVPAAPAPAPSQADIAARIQGIINSEPGDSKSKRLPPAEAQPATPPPALKEQKTDEQEATPEPEAPVGPNKQAEGDDAPQEDAQGMAEIPLDQLENIELEISVQGEKRKLPIKELRDGYMKDADYRKKTADLNRQREQLHEETRKATDAERMKYVTELQTLHDLVTQTAASELGNVDWNDLAQNNAFEYVRLDNRKKQITHTLETIRAKQQEVLSKHSQEQKAAMQKAATEARDQLEKDIPGWNDALYQSLMKAGIEKFGYKQDEVTSWVDPRAFKLLHKAHLYDQLQAEKTAPPADKKVSVPPKVVRPGPQRETSQQANRDANALKQLRTSGRSEDAAAVIKNRLG